MVIAQCFKAKRKNYIVLGTKCNLHLQIRFNKTKTLWCSARSSSIQKIANQFLFYLIEALTSLRFSLRTAEMAEMLTRGTCFYYDFLHERPKGNS